MKGTLASGEVNALVSQIEDSGVYKRHFWRNLANMVDEKAHMGRIKNVNEGDTIDLAYRIEMHHEQQQRKKFYSSHQQIYS